MSENKGERVFAVAKAMHEADPDVGCTWEEWVKYAEKHPDHMQAIEFVRRQARAVVDALGISETEPPAPVEGVTQVISADELGQIMQDEWGDICEDAQAHPLDIDRQGRKLFYNPRHWTDAIARRLNERAALASRTTSGEAVAVIGKDWSLLWASPDTLTGIVARTGISIGTKLYTHPATETETETVTALRAYAVAGPWESNERDENDTPLWHAEVQIIGGHSVIAETWGGSKNECQTRAELIAAALNAEKAGG